jgi:hypothetical protein
MEGLAVPFPHLLPLPPVPKLGTVSAAISTSTSTPTGNYLLTLLALHSNNFSNLHFISSYLLATILYTIQEEEDSFLSNNCVHDVVLPIVHHHHRTPSLGENM